MIHIGSIVTEGCIVGVSLPYNGKCEIGSYRSINDRVGLMVRDASDVMRHLNLPEFTPTDLVREALVAMHVAREATPDERTTVIEKGRLFRWLSEHISFGANAAALAAALCAAATSNQFEAWALS